MSEIEDVIRRADTLLPGVPAPAGEIDPRWQAIIEVGAFVEAEPEAVWLFTARWGVHEQDDLRSAIATCVLEHLLDAHFELIFPRAARLAHDNDYFADTFRRCSKFGDATASVNSARWDELLSRLR